MKVPLKRFLFASSIAAAGASGAAEVFDENRVSNPTSEYGKSKLLIEESLAEVHPRLPSTVVRLPLVYGPRCFRGLYPVFRLASRGIHLKTAGNTSTLGYVEDVVEGMILAAALPNASGRLYYLGEDRIYRSDEITAAIVNAFGGKSVRIRIPKSLMYAAASFSELFGLFTRRTSSLRRRSLSNYFHTHWRFTSRRAAEELGYTTRFPLGLGIRITADWYRENGFL